LEAGGFRLLLHPAVAGGTFTDMAAKVKEQNLAVFGEDGSGKTVLLSSFYGAAQGPSFLAESLDKVLADDTGKGTRLRQNYLRMRNQAEAPEASRFTAAPYSFTLKLTDPGDGKAARAKPFDALRLVWHDYPGEWFTQEPSSAEGRSTLSEVSLLTATGRWHLLPVSRRRRQGGTTAAAARLASRAGHTFGIRPAAR